MSVRNNKHAKMWKTFQFFLFFKINFTFAKLAGDHVCLTEETYPVNVTEWYEKNATVRNYRWCYNVPPRCSYYTLKRINDTRIVEKNETITVEKCCPGFLEKENHCVSSCPLCKNGVCENGICNCLPGYKGHSCELDCPRGEWGPNCSRSCNCPNECDPKTGICSEQTTKNPPIITTQTSPGTTIKEEPTREPTIIEEQTRTTTKPPLFTTIEQLHSTTTKSPVTTIEEEQIGTTAKSSSTTSKEEQLRITAKSSSTTSKEEQLRTTGKSSSTTSYEEQIRTTTSSGSTVKEEQTKKNLGPIVTKQGLLIPVEIQYELKQKPTTYSTVRDKNFLEMSNEEYSNRQMSMNNNFPADEFALFGITVLLALMLIVAVLTGNFLRKRKKKNFSQNGKRHLSAFSASIFHSPLPDPPVTENPLYMNPVKCQGDKDLPAFETRIICNVNNTPNAVEIEYDHPPSIVNVKRAPLADAANMTRPVDDRSIIEPVYDEIPQKDDVQQDNSTLDIYINTCGRTKF
ncbi:unnamed protein product [Phyllotreta striolata]|uniref:EMI domain-containing protein n=1 Tax=Phyllotreta striolata TaxID=444603 RepID=A0A9N9TVF4_PHYSR|nr:unnamed protein product [Phyllotreta striolata]